jgi:hypothetical protein
MAGYTRSYMATVKPCQKTISLRVDWHDICNWDGSKTFQIQGKNYSDKILGRLHQAGIAQEFEMGGHKDFTFRY